MVDYFLKSKYRGLLLYHALGSGKSCTSILYTDSMILQKKKVHFFSPASIRKNFIDEYCKVCGKSSLILEQKFIFYSYNYSGIIDKLPDNLDDSIIIVDEAHNVINGKRNNSKTFSTIYNLIHDAKNAKLLLLSGTPIKKIYDIPILLDWLKPGTFKLEYDLLGNFVEENFDKYLKSTTISIADSNYTIDVPKSMKQFEEFFKGVISYVAGADPRYYPTRKDQIIHIKMSENQSFEFNNIIDWEKNILAIPLNEIKKKKNKKLEALWQVANKRLFARAISNFSYPKKIKIGEDLYQLDIKCDLISKGKKIIKKCEKPDLPTLPDKLLREGGWIYPSVFEPKRLSTMYSPKIYKMLEIISDRLYGKHMIYSSLKTRSGVQLVKALLEMCGLKTLVYSGDIPSDKKRAEILEKFNSVHNLYGEKYKVILLTEAGGEGLTLKAVRYIHILESDKNESKIQQVIGRAIRYKSHEGLPEKERTCNVYRYFSDPDIEFLISKEIVSSQNVEEIRADPTSREKVSVIGIDEGLYRDGLVAEEQKNIFLKILKDTTI